MTFPEFASKPFCASIYDLLLQVTEAAATCLHCLVNTAGLKFQIKKLEALGAWGDK